MSGFFFFSCFCSWERERGGDTFVGQRLCHFADGAQMREGGMRLRLRAHTRVFSKTEPFGPGYIETVTRIRTDPELFENARSPIRSFSKTLPKVDLSKMEVLYPDLSCV